MIFSSRMEKSTMSKGIRMLRETTMEVRIIFALRKIHASVWNSLLLMAYVHLRNLTCKRQRHRNCSLEGTDYCSGEVKDMAVQTEEEAWG